MKMSPTTYAMEKNIAMEIDKKVILKDELVKLIELKRNPEFAGDVKVQNEAILLCRGMDIKFRNMSIDFDHDSDEALANRERFS